MDCRTFRQNHCAFIDDVMPGVDTVAMARHRVECPRCAHLDARVRRSLLVVRNLRPVECSAEFTERLYRRLRETSVDRRSTLAGPGLGTFGVAAAAVLMVSAGALALVDQPMPRDLVLPPVVASAPAPASDPFSSPSIMASVSAGMPMWPALLLADEMPMRVAQSGFQFSTLAY